MPVISISIGKSRYQIDCPIGEEEKIQKLAAKMNERVNNLSLVIRNADEKTILMLCGLTAEEELENLTKSSPVKDYQNNGLDEGVPRVLVDNMEKILNQINLLTAKVK